MIKREVAELLIMIKNVFPNFVVDQSKIDTWSMLLKSHDNDVVVNNTKSYLMENKFPPTISEIKQVKNESRNNDYLEKHEEMLKNAHTPDWVKERLKELKQTNEN